MYKRQHFHLYAARSDRIYVIDKHLGYFLMILMGNQPTRNFGIGYNTIYNPAPVSLLGSEKQVRRLMADRLRLQFTVEGACLLYTSPVFQ